MIFLLALPVFAAVALAHRWLQMYAPTNRLVRRVRIAAPRFRTAVGLLAAAAVLLIAMHMVATAVAAGAPGWLNLVVLVLGWDAIKVSWLAVGVVLRLVALGVRRLTGRSARLRSTPTVESCVTISPSSVTSRARRLLRCPPRPLRSQTGRWTFSARRSTPVD